MRLKNLDLIIGLIVTAINVGWTLLPDHSSYLTIIGIILALPLVFVLPGYTLTEALFKRSGNSSEDLIRQPALKLERPFKTSDRIIIGLGLSLALVILSGFILNMFSTGLQAFSWVVCLALQTMVFSLIAAYRRRSTPASEVRTSRRFKVGLSDYLLLGLAIIVTLGSFNYAAYIALNQPRPGFTQLWMLPTPQTNNSCSMLVGVHSSETGPTTYRIVMTINNTQTENWPSVALMPQQDWNQLVPLQPATIDTMNIAVQLYRADKPDAVYRETHITLSSSGSGENRTITCSLNGGTKASSS
ncbi:hypothetical protein KSF_022080 [Reticulibacter mediterranei]|uniref:DUF1616 domain-containing protein n=1 Tax=Reticulibacter mediterranei TaxID=2778369 RepID=A0A8J3IJY2_9CHLR|nr:DUF1616 domain-containing protein [Reticulibacter mediterranei]GHO92160.1 hypothetical protein KSF_022080 [Reticulibacter mediterranei]